MAPALEFSWWYDDSELSQPSESETSSDQDTDPEPESAPPVVRSTPKVSEVKPTKATRPSTQQATKQSKDRIAAKSSPYLKSPRTTTYSLSSLHGNFIGFFQTSKKDWYIVHKNGWNREPSIWIPNIKEVYIFALFLDFFFSSKNCVAVVWTTQKQESLIDSFYHNFYVPPIIFGEHRVHTLTTEFSNPYSVNRSDYY